MEIRVHFKQKNEDERIVEGAVYISNIVDAHGDYIDSHNILKFYNYVEGLKKSERDKLFDVNHNRKATKSEFLYHFINGVHREDDKYPLGAWVMATKIDEQTWEKVKSKELNAYSMDFFAKVRKVEAAILLVKDNFGMTSNDEDHEHRWYVRLDDEGRAITGNTDEVEINGVKHFHLIDGSAVKTKSFVGDDGVEHNHRILQTQ